MHQCFFQSLVQLGIMRYTTNPQIYSHELDQLTLLTLLILLILLTRYHKFIAKGYVFLLGVYCKICLTLQFPCPVAVWGIVAQCLSSCEPRAWLAT